VDCGEGHACSLKSEATFRVVLWPGGVALRRAVGLPPRDFHITLGFSKTDVHSSPKALVSLTRGVSATALEPLAQLAAQLVEPGEGVQVDAEGAEIIKAALMHRCESSGSSSPKQLCNERPVTGGSTPKDVEIILTHDERDAEDDLGGKDKIQLRAICENMGIDSTGGAAKLRLRIRSHRSETDIKTTKDPELHDVTAESL